MSTQARIHRAGAFSISVRSAGTLLSRIRAPPPAPWPDGGPESLRSPCCVLAIYKNQTPNLAVLLTSEDSVQLNLQTSNHFLLPVNFFFFSLFFPTELLGFYCSPQQRSKVYSLTQELQARDFLTGSRLPINLTW
ncbi:hypothetical protein PoB_004461900 [Plakobranchus ocellatus]|uniref:Uncharacterized protein n=1 Tax=Plakobranchus ocellatus TaxID=259542 RepID=A0AAV4BGX8_9GAST|nr:hypothetical protein PoB_004461900 [Plakobranchus ocellatus]